MNILDFLNYINLNNKKDKKYNNIIDNNNNNNFFDLKKWKNLRKSILIWDKIYNIK